MILLRIIVVLNVDLLSDFNQKYYIIKKYGAVHSN